MSGSVLEAMATGLPVAAPSASGMAQLVRPDSGQIARDPSSAALGQALRTLLDDAAPRGAPGGRAALGGRARQIVVEDYSLESTADQLTALYHRLTGSSA